MQPVTYITIHHLASARSQLYIYNVLTGWKLSVTRAKVLNYTQEESPVKQYHHTSCAMLNHHTVANMQLHITIVRHGIPSFACCLLKIKLKQEHIRDALLLKGTDYQWHRVDDIMWHKWKGQDLHHSQWHMCSCQLYYISYSGKNWTLNSKSKVYK